MEIQIPKNINAIKPIQIFNFKAPTSKLPTTALENNSIIADPTKAKGDEIQSYHKLLTNYEELEIEEPPQ